jgi:hypothetical protein
VQYLRTVADGCIATLLPAEDASRPLIRPLLRELLAACLLRPAMMYLTSPCINKLLLQVGGPAGLGRHLLLPAGCVAAFSGRWAFPLALVSEPAALKSFEFCHLAAGVP